MSFDPPKQFDSLVGEVYGNVLDLTDNYTYVAKLYMIPPVCSAAVSSGVSESGAAARTETGISGAASGKGGYMNNATNAPPSETIVLAQTGVTGAQIDNIEITQQMGPGNTIAVSKVNFEIIQPGAANFLDQIMASKAAIGAPVFAPDVPIFLEIVFKGYTADMSDLDTGGVPVVIAGPYRYRLELATVSFEINETGSTYSFECVPSQMVAYSDTMFRMPKTFTTSGGTITDHIDGPDGLIRHLKDYQENNNSASAVKDEIIIDLSGISAGAKYGLQNLKIDTNVDAEEINRLMNDELTGKTADEYKEILKAKSKDEGALDIVVEKDRITVREGTTMERYITTLLAMNKDFFQKLTRKVNPEDNSNTEVDREQAFVNWFKVNAEVETIDYDVLRNKYARRIYFKPLIYNTSKATVCQLSTENANLTEQEVRARLSAMNIKKSYHYIFTGQNDQIYSCQIKHTNSIDLLLPPAGGATGDVSVVTPTAFRSIASTNADLTNTTLARAAAKASSAEQVSAIIGSALQTQGGRESITETAKWLGLSDNSIKEILENKNSATAQAFSAFLSEQRNAEIVAEQLDQQKKNTSSDNISNSDGTAYKPTPSGYIYAADIVSSFVSGGGYGQEAERLRLSSQLASAIRTAETESSRETTSTVSGASSGLSGVLAKWFPKIFDGNGNPGDALSPSLQNTQTTNETADATYNAKSIRNNVFGFVMQQHGASKFMNQLDLEIKGDPWYLGNPDLNGRTTPDQPGAEYLVDSTERNVEFSGDENHVMFELRTPGLFDFDTTDEDNNTGYWSQEGVSYFISGVYMIRTVVHNFRDGIFSQNLMLIKNDTLRTSVLERRPFNSTAE
jgi:hypothetical protein